MSEKKPRIMAIGLHIDEGDSVHGVWSEEAQRMTLRVIRDGKAVSARKVESTTYYERPKKPKILSRQEFSRSRDFTVSAEESVQLFSQLWAIDTNHKEIFGYSANAAVATVCGTDGAGTYYPVLAMVFGEVSGNPELFAWRRFIEFAQGASSYDAGAQYALVVDSELSMIPKLNDQSTPIHGKFYLPKNWKLIYATSDSGKESIFNQLIASSDRAASKVLNLIATKESNVKHWLPVTDEEHHQPSWLTFAPPKGQSD